MPWGHFFLSHQYWKGSHDIEHKYMSQADKDMADGIERMSDDINEVKSNVMALTLSITFESKLVKLDKKSVDLIDNLEAFGVYPMKVVTNDTIYQLQTVDHAIVSSFQKSPNSQLRNYRMVDVREINESDKFTRIDSLKGSSNEQVTSGIKIFYALSGATMTPVPPYLLEGLAKKREVELSNFKLIEPSFWASSDYAIDYSPDLFSKLKLGDGESAWITVLPIDR